MNLADLIKDAIDTIPAAFCSSWETQRHELAANALEERLQELIEAKVNQMLKRV